MAQTGNPTIMGQTPILETIKLQLRYFLQQIENNIKMINIAYKQVSL